MRKIQTPTVAATTTLHAHDLAIAAGGMPFGFGGHKEKSKDKERDKPKETRQTSSQNSYSSYDSRASRDPWMKSAKKQQGMTMDQFMGYSGSRYYR